MGARVLVITGLATAAVLLTGCGSTPEEDLEGWWSSGGETRIRNLTDDASSVNRLSMSPSSVLAPACRKLLTRVTEAEKYEPIPDDGIQEFWADALASFKRGASACASGADQQDDAQVSQGVMEVQTEGLPHLKSTVSLLRRQLEAG